MLSSTLSDGLRQYRIGAKLRALRLHRKMGLVELGKHTGLSAAMLSKIERDRLFPTLPTLLRIALAFGVGLDHFFTETDGRPAVVVVRKRDRLRFSNAPDSAAPTYSFESLDFPAPNRRMNAYYAEFDSTAEAGPRHQHAGVELIFLIEGKLAVAFEDGDQLLDAGDAIYFDSDQPHGYRRIGPMRCAAVVVTA